MFAILMVLEFPSGDTQRIDAGSDALELAVIEGEKSGISDRSVFSLQRSRTPGNMAGGEGFEPPLAESESAVLPLDDPPVVPAPGKPDYSTCHARGAARRPVSR